MRTMRRALTRNDIQRILREKGPDLRERYHVRSLSLFGSYARGEATAQSDIDLLVDFERLPTLFEFMDLEEELTRLLGVRVDLVSRKALRGERGKRILQEEVRL